MENEAIQESRKTEIAALSEHYKKELAVITEDWKLEMNALSDQHKQEIEALQDKLKTVIQEHKHLTSGKSLAGPKHVKVEAEAEQAKDDRMFNLMMKRKELETTGFSAIEIDEQLPLPRKDDCEPNKKRRRRVVKTEEET